MLNSIDNIIMTTTIQKEILDESIHNFVKIIIKYVYDQADENEINICLEQMNDAKRAYYN